MPRIKELFAFVIADTGPDDEGIIGMHGPDGAWLPFVGADLARVESLLPMAQAVADEAGKPIRILRFTDRHEFGMIAPAQPGPLRSEHLEERP